MALAASYFLVPGAGPARGAIYSGLTLAASAALWVGPQLYRPAHTRPWQLLAVGYLFYAGAAVVWFTRPPFPSFADLLFVVAYSLIAAGLAQLVRARTGPRASGGWLDALTVTTGVAVLSWVFLMAPHVHDSTLPLQSKLVSLFYPVVDIVLLGLAIRLSLAAAGDIVAFRLLGAGIVAQLVADTAFAVTTLNGTFHFGHPLLLGWLVSFALVASAALHPSMAELCRPHNEEPGAGGLRLSLITAAALVPSIVLFVGSATGRLHDVPVITGISTALFLLVIARVAGLTSVIDERKRIEEKLREAETRYRLLVEQLPGVVYEAEPSQGAWRYVSPRIEAMLGFSPTEWMANPKLFVERVHPDDRDEVSRRRAEVLGNERLGGFSGEYRLIAKDGRTVWVQDEATLHRDRTGRPLFFRGVLLDVTNRRGAEEEVKLYAEIVNHMPIGVNVWRRQSGDPSGLVLAAINPAASRYLGVGLDAVGSTLQEVAPELMNTSVPEICARVVATNRSAHLQELGYGEGDRTFSATALPLPGESVGLLLEDVTERIRGERQRERLEEQLRQSQKMEAIGQLAGGIAHDFNNLMTVVQNYARFVLDDLDYEDIKRADLEEILKAGERAKRLVRQLLTFARKELSQPVVLDVNEVLEDMRDLLRRSLRESIDLEISTSEEPCLIYIDKSQLEQILLNLTVNARDAMPGVGTLEIRTGITSGEDAASVRELAPPAGDYVKLTVRDTGIGMTPEVQARIFEPFYTTKGRAEGSGLGLATVYGIVKRARGHLTVRSSPGQGATFTVYLPAILEEAAGKVPEADSTSHPGRGESILLVEDEEGIRGLVERVLSHAGYAVTAAGSGDEALRLLSRQERAPDLLLTDVVMPQMSGKQLSVKVKATHPGARVLFMTGYAEHVVAQHGVALAGERVLSKPFSTEDLLKAVRETLEDRVGKERQAAL